jgi:hypothetical protein
MKTYKLCSFTKKLIWDYLAIENILKLTMQKPSIILVMELDW